MYQNSEGLVLHRWIGQAPDPGQGRAFSTWQLSDSNVLGNCDHETPKSQNVTPEKRMIVFARRTVNRMGSGTPDDFRPTISYGSVLAIVADDGAQNARVILKGAGV